MKTLRQANVGDTVKVIKLHGRGSTQTPYHGYGADKGD